MYESMYESMYVCKCSRDSHAQFPHCSMHTYCGLPYLIHKCAPAPACPCSCCIVHLLHRSFTAYSPDSTACFPSLFLLSVSFFSVDLISSLKLHNLASFTPWTMVQSHASGFTKTPVHVTNWWLFLFPDYLIIT